jgi:hypothetical protein
MDRSLAGTRPLSDIEHWSFHALVGTEFVTNCIASLNANEFARNKHLARALRAGNEFAERSVGDGEECQAILLLLNFHIFAVMSGQALEQVLNLFLVLMIGWTSMY